ncbi:MAG TPA: ABC transporter permease, partial [Verrucomicrobiae bacterium]|nr:ABC transporter permease [Verrucomicrobiae bacterium]
MGSRVTCALAITWLAVIAVCAVAAARLPFLPPDSIDWANLAVKPGTAGHLLGTDNMGRDIASRLAFGSRVSLTVGLLAPCIGLLLGSLLGVVSGFFRGAADRVIGWGIDTFLAFPRLVFLLMVMCVFGSRFTTLTTALGIVCAPSFARVARANTLK